MTVPTVQRCYAALHTSASVWDAKTGLYDFHVKHGAKIVPFGGYSMPLTYEAHGALCIHVRAWKREGHPGLERTALASRTPHTPVEMHFNLGKICSAQMVDA
jgi:hypothetical protein